MERGRREKEGWRNGFGGREDRGWGAKKRGRYRTTQITDICYLDLLSHLLGSCTLSVFGRGSHDNVILPTDLGTHLGSSSG